MVTIPKKIYQTWSQKELPSAMQAAASSWGQLNPDWDICIFNDKQCRDFIAQHFDNEVLSAYDQLIPGAYRADLWRYCVLYINGGVYADIKLKALLPLSKFVEPEAGFVTVIDEPPPSLLGIGSSGRSYLMQGFMACTPNHPALLKAIQAVVQHVQQGNYTTDYLSITGPGLLGRVINQCLERDELTNYEAGIYKTENSVYQFLPPWDRKENLFRDASGNAFIDRSCKGYRKAANYQGKVVHDYDVIKGQYARCWFLSMVFKNGQAHFPVMNQKQQAIFDHGKQRATLHMVKLLNMAGAFMYAKTWSSQYLKHYGFSFKLFTYLCEGKLRYYVGLLSNKK